MVLNNVVFDILPYVSGTIQLFFFQIYRHTIWLSLATDFLFKCRRLVEGDDIQSSLLYAVESFYICFSVVAYTPLYSLALLHNSVQL